MESNSPILVAVAWPYANGPLHLGHVAGSLLPPDIFARYQRLRGRPVAMVGGSDMHGTPITFAAEKEGVSPEELAARYHELHEKAIEALGIHFDCFTSTATENHRAVVHDVFRGLLAAGLIERRGMISPYDPKAERFLPDRYVEGTCPVCRFAGARGDQCDNCGRTLDPQDLLDPRSKLTGVAPEYRETEHFFLLLSKLQGPLERWTAEQSQRGNWRPAVRNFTEQWLRDGLRDRAITRDLTYGVPIPDEVGGTEDKRIYVWFEAVIGYLSATIEWATANGDPGGFRRFWSPDNGSASCYFLGKDNTPFHTIIWPAMLLGYNQRPGGYGPLALPFDVAANEFLQFKGAKFSKSRGGAFYVLDALQMFEADAIRFYLCAIMPERSDTDWVLAEFVSKVNDELVATVGNYANRVLAMCEKNWGGLPPERPGALTVEEWERFGKPFVDSIPAALAQAAEAFEAREFRRALRSLIGLAAQGNRAFEAMAPWSLLKQGEAGRDRAGMWLRLHVCALRALAVGLQPILPTVSEALWEQLGAARPADQPSIRSAAEKSHPGLDVWPGSELAPLPNSGKLGLIRPLVKKLDRDVVLAEFAGES